MKIWNKCICFTSRKTMMILATLLISTLVLASVWPNEEPAADVIPPEPKEEPWIPTKEDIEYQDSMYTIINQTSADVDTIKADIDRILFKLERLEYADGTYDSIRYPENGPIDKRRN
jgi:hypothetical protein